MFWRKRKNLLTYTRTSARNNIKRITFDLKSKSRTPFTFASCFSKYIVLRASISGLNREKILCVAAPYESHRVVAHLRTFRGVSPSNYWAFSMTENFTNEYFWIISQMNTKCSNTSASWSFQQFMYFM